MAQPKKPRPKAPPAPKSLHRPEYAAVLKTLVDLRGEAGLLQAELGRKLGRSQSYVSMAERGIIRLDALQLHDWSSACGSTLTAFAKRLEKSWAKNT
ncbi:helix-turn-helix domain-containing protein [Dyella terrae]|uniref:helix-turn-helix domain-containing protein n=1 Tax=Dyella terrae TaxID=522259 RepID=UPI001EFD6F54|nr:helix-turn-helix transcriptional regulator [Dyella terrae]ULU23170.1 helix-turn-helix transcriptional regulator [Dyella terrae]